MSDDLVKNAIAELQDDVRCRCHPAYKDRGLHDPDCNCDSAGAVQVVTDRIEELEAKLKLADEISNLQADRIEELEEERRKNFQALLRVTEIHDEVEVKLAKAVDALELADAALSGANMNMRVVEQRVKAAIAELKGDQ
jgi:hypothetical protein